MKIKKNDERSKDRKKFFDPEGLYIIAEAGVNHNGNLKKAMEMVEVAKASGADAVKFQTWITERVYSREESIKPEYQMQGTDPKESEYDTVKKNELSFDSFRKLKTHCDKTGITMLSTPDEWESADFLVNELKLPAVKVASQDVNNLPFLNYLGSRQKPIILSTGASSLAEVSAAVKTILSAGCPSLAVLHCTSCYPAPAESVNLLALKTIRKALRLPIGYSDHTMGHHIGCGAVALGACLLEKHFTLSKRLSGPDQQASLEPDELKAYVAAVRQVKTALGSGVKEMSPEEASNQIAMRRYLATARNLPAGHVIRREDIALKKISFGLGPEHFNIVLGSTLRVALTEGDRFHLDHLQFKHETGFSNKVEKSHD